MAKDEKKNPQQPEQSGSHTGGPDREPGQKGAQDPFHQPATDASPERFLGQVPDHIAAQGADAPPTPNALEDVKGRRRFRMHLDSGKIIGRQLRPAGETFWLDPAEAAKHPELTEVDAAGNPVHADKISTRQTGEARGLTTR